MARATKRALHSTALLVGSMGILSQTLLFRELSIVLRSNDLIVGVLLFFWLLFAGLGSLLRPAHRRWEIVVSLLFVFSSLSTIWLHLIARSLSPGMGEIWPFSRTTIFIASSVFPAAFFAGASFSALSESIPDSSKAFKIYIFEGIGAFLGGLISLCVAPILPARVVLPVFAALSLGILAFAVDGRKRRIAAILSVAILALVPLLDRVDTTLASGLKKGYEVERFESARGAIEVARRGNERALFQGGKYLGTSGDSSAAERFVHPLMVSIADSPRVALCGGILQGAAEDILAYDPESLFVLVEERRMLRIGAANFEAFRRLDAPELRVIVGDPRRTLLDLPKGMDLIVFYAGIPTSAAGSRIFSESAFRNAAKKLAPNGKIAIGFRISPNVPNREEAALVGSILGAARNVFGEAEAYVAEGTAFIVAPDAGEFAERLCDGNFQKPRSSHISKGMIRDLFDPFRQRELRRAIAAESAPPNTDDRPVALLLGITLWERLADDTLFMRLSSMSFSLWAIAIALFSITAFIIARASRSAGIGAALTVASVGTIGMSLEIIALYGFQVAAGQLYAAIGLLSSLFIAGSVGGAWLSSRGRIDLRRWRLLLLLVVPLAAATIKVPALSLGVVASIFIYGFFQCYIGFIAGSLYPLVLKWAGSNGIWAEKAAGKAYAFDLIGASIAAPLVGVFFVPAYGLERTLLLLFILIIFVETNRLGKRKHGGSHGRYE